MSETIITSVDNAVLTIRFNRPDQLNAFNEEMHGAFHAALKYASDDAIRAVLITGTGRAFCAGQDLGDRNPDDTDNRHVDNRLVDNQPDLEDTITRFYNPAVRLIRALPKPIICAVNGVAAGAGANLAFGCDIVIANENAKFIQSFAKVGLVPDAGGSWLLPQLIGQARAKALAMTAMPLSAKQAVEWGLIWQALPEAEYLPEAQKMAMTLAQGASFGLGLTKQAIHQAADNSLDEHLNLEAKYQGQAGRSDDYAEGVRAFLQKRSAKFTGK